jgi:RNA polymerase sigma factor (sigma-70 family)
MTEASQGRKPEDAAEEDLRLIDRVLGGDRQAFEALVRSHERRVFRVTLAVLGQAEDAEDAMQEPFIKAYRHLTQFRRESRFTTWLTRTAVNEALQRLQSRKDHPRHMIFLRRRMKIETPSFRLRRRLRIIARISR